MKNVIFYLFICFIFLHLNINLVALLYQTTLSDHDHFANLIRYEVILLLFLAYFSYIF